VKSENEEGEKARLMREVAQDKRRGTTKGQSSKFMWSYFDFCLLG
jgi:hypothetical protein